MKCNITVENDKISLAVSYIEKHLRRIKIIPLDKLNIKWGIKDNAYGICRYPYKKLGYRISCFLPKNGPGIALTRGDYQISKKRKYISFKDLNETCVWIYGHEIFHYLCHNKQILGENLEKRADKYADKFLQKFKKSC